MGGSLAGAARFGGVVALRLIRGGASEPRQFYVAHFDLNQRVKGPELEAAGSPNTAMFKLERPLVKKKMNHINRLEIE